MFDNIRRKFSHQKHKVFYKKTSKLGIFEDLVYYNDVGYPLPIVRAMKKASAKSFRYIYKTSKSVKLKGVGFEMLECPKGTFIMGHIEQVSWEDAILFCNRLSELQGLDKCYTKNSSEKYDWLCDFGKDGYRLPTEKEWEYAAKTGTENRWSGTDDEKKLKKYAVYRDNLKRSTQSTESVGSKAPNEWGFYDMSGNVQEWCWDKYDPNDDEDSAIRVNRGGCWGSRDAWNLRSAFRRSNSPGSRRDALGFRICRTFASSDPESSKLVKKRKTKKDA